MTGAAPNRRQDERHVYCGNCEGVDPDTCINAVSPVPGQQREAVADELARHTDTLSYTRDDDTVRLGCTCGHQRGTVTKAELATDLDGRMREHRLHVADAVIAVLGGLLDVHTPRVNGDAITTDKEHT